MYPQHELKKSISKPCSNPVNVQAANENIYATMQSWENVQTW